MCNPEKRGISTHVFLVVGWLVLDEAWNAFVCFHSNLPYDVSPEQALGHPEVQRRLDISIRNLLAVTDKFLSAITSSVDQIPYEFIVVSCVFL